jgi:hypothetical protein
MLANAESRRVATCTPEMQPQRPYSRGGAVKKWRQWNGIPIEMPAFIGGTQ